MESISLINYITPYIYIYCPLSLNHLQQNSQMYKLQTNNACTIVFFYIIQHGSVTTILYVHNQYITFLYLDIFWGIVGASLVLTHKSHPRESRQARVGQTMPGQFCFSPGPAPGSLCACGWCAYAAAAVAWDSAAPSKTGSTG